MRHLLAHRCTLHRRGAATGEEDGYGRPTYADMVSTQVPCLFLAEERTESKDEKGNDVVLVGMLFFGPDRTVAEGDTVTDLKDSGGTLLRDATLRIIRTKKARSPFQFSHWECLVSELQP